MCKGELGIFEPAAGAALTSISSPYGVLAIAEGGFGESVVQHLDSDGNLISEGSGGNHEEAIESVLPFVAAREVIGVLRAFEVTGL